jgi:hypothetical protein
MYRSGINVRQFKDAQDFVKECSRMNLHKGRRDKRRGSDTPARRDKSHGKTAKVKGKNEEACRTENQKPLRKTA